MRVAGVATATTCIFLILESALSISRLNFTRDFYYRSRFPDGTASSFVLVNPLTQCVYVKSEIVSMRMLENYGIG